MIKQISITTPDQGLHEITAQIGDVISDSGTGDGVCTVFLQHTSASLLIQENADFAARRDLEQWMNRLVREDDPLYTHTNEGPDDMPSHIKSMLTANSLTIPFIKGRLALGTWQGVFLWEHRYGGGRRKLVVHLAP
jgi:secondary thiamine-phosphate synthase enzyme